MKNWAIKLNIIKRSQIKPNLNKTMAEEKLPPEEETPFEEETSDVPEEVLGEEPNPEDNPDETEI